MKATRRSIAIQIWMLIPVVCAVLLGLAGVLIPIAAPDSLGLLTGSAGQVNGLVLALAGACLLAEIRGLKRARILLALVLAVVTVYGLVPVLGDVDPVPLYTRGMTFASTVLALLLVSACLIPESLQYRQRIWRPVGVLAVVFGATLAGSPFIASDHGATLAVYGFASVVAGVSVLALGAVALELSRAGYELNSRLPSAFVRRSFLGLSFGIATSCLVLLFQHHEREQSAALQLTHIESSLVSALEGHSATIRSIADRWQAMGGLPDHTILNVESYALFHGQGYFRALGYVDRSEGTFWRNGQNAGTLLWLDEQLLDPDVRQWISANERERRQISWRVTSMQAERAALIWLSLRINSNAYLIASVDLAGMIDQVLEHEGGEFAVRLQGAASGSSPSLSRGAMTEFASVTVPIDDVDALTLTASGPFYDAGSIGGKAAIGVFMLGILLTYYWLMSRSMQWAQREKDAQLRKSEQRFRSLFSRNPNIVFALDNKGCFTGINPETEIALGRLEPELVGTHYSEVAELGEAMVCGDMNINELFAQACAGQTINFQFNFRRADRERRIYDVTLMAIETEGQTEGVFGVAQDITCRVAAEEQQQVLLRSLEASGNAVMICDAREAGFPVVYVNPAFSRIAGYSSTEVIGGEPNLLVGDDTAESDLDAIRNAVEARKPLSITIRSYRRSGEQFWNQLSLSPVMDDQQVLSHYIAVMNDISEQKERDQQLAFQATHDVLTGLGNRSLFDDRIEHDFALARRNGSTLAVFFIDLDEFKPINDTLGHKIGDAVLVSVTRRLSANLRPTDTLCRFGGDEFVLLVPDLSDASEAEDIAERLLDELAGAHRIDGHELHVSASIGIATLDNQITEPEKLLQHADMAMYKAKKQGRNTYEVYSGNLDDKLNARVSLRNELQEAIARDQLCLHYQPLLDAAGNVDGIEALVRWEHPDKGWISPADFIPLAEQTGQIAPLSRWILERACADALVLTEQGLLSGRMAVNLSPLQFHRPNFLAGLRKTLDRTGLPPQSLELELTEGILMQDASGTIDILNALSGMGVTTAIDDFGTGYSSLSYLRTLPIDKIKIDKSFVQDVNDNDKDAAICKGVIALARELNLRVVAEGVETQAQYDYLRACGCNVFQGFLLARPMPLGRLIEWLGKVRSREALMITNEK